MQIESKSVVVNFWRDYKNGQKVLTRCAVTDKESSVTVVATVGIHPNDSFDILKGRIESLWKAVHSNRVLLYDAAGQNFDEKRYVDELRPKVGEYEMAELMAMVAINRSMELTPSVEYYYEMAV